MIIAIGVMFVTSLLLVAAFSASQWRDPSERHRHRAEEGLLCGARGNQELRDHLTRTATTSPTAPILRGQRGPKPSGGNIIERRTEERGNGWNGEYRLSCWRPTATCSDRKCDPKQPCRKRCSKRSHPGAVGHIRIESTGYSGAQQGVPLVADFRNANFVSFVWYFEVRNRRSRRSRRTAQRKRAGQLLHGMLQVLRGTSADGGEPRRHQQPLHQRRIRQRPDPHRGSRRRVRRAGLWPLAKRARRIWSCSMANPKRRILWRGRLL